jgi:nitrile hydratase accessory protein
LNPSIERPETEAQVFREPWEAQVFAMAVSLHEVGLFTWPEWTETLAEEMRPDLSAGPCGEATYQAWLSALEVMLIRKAVTDRDGLVALRNAWDLAARATPHGQPIVLCERGARG